ncbi:leucine-rich repeat domain-containing protein [uncultured Adlercreutzia sp.]|uniref:leucine-rich repeat domain-containing protein n=1 Tax=uncultured Adlercreutzia sp. TaxID=875803 RepID=UPI002600F3E6|nr:leucine-rich repeat domain-containing protein [uncultured Adlercreutzia sp.]MCI9261580.1 leucine-rich repeat domain-containing protein [Eggerthellaceae bacterium]
MKRLKKGRKGKVAASLALSVALCATLGAGTAVAAGTTTVGGNGANWTVPTTPMTNTVWKDAKGNVVPANTAGAKQYKVLTTWAEAWSTSGPDYLGVSNSAYYGNGGNGNPKITDLASAQKNSTIGVWATAANESPNAYNWNTFYNFYAKSKGAGLSDWATVSSAGTDGSSYWDSASGVWVGFKYRPEVVWLNNNLSEENAKKYISYIQKGQYSASDTQVKGSNDRYSYSEPVAGEDGSYDSKFYIEGDKTYNPAIIQPNNNSPYSFVNSAFTLASAAEDVMQATSKNTGLAAGEQLNWSTVNKLPRSNRYTETPTECAVNIEKLARGSVYYTLAKINDGTVKKKKVAYVAYPFNNTKNVTTSATQVVVAVYDFTENIGSGPMDGRASWSPLVVDQLKTNSVQTAKTGGGAVSSSDDSTTTYTLYYATADDLASCDVIYSPHNSVTAKEWQEWIEKNATTAANKAKAASISYIASSPAVTNGSNFTMEKLIYGAYAMDCIYPELFKNMALSTYWCDEVYHLKDSSLPSAMSWIYASASLPAGTTLSNIGKTYKLATVDNKFEIGYNYFQKAMGTDPTIKRVLTNTALDGTTQLNGVRYAFNGFAPSGAWAKASHAVTADDVSAPAAPAATAPAATVKKGDQKTIGSLKYKVLTVASNGTGTVSVVGHAKTKAKATGKVTIPATVKINGKSFKVTAVASKAFYNYKKITKITVGKYVTSIGSNAFRGCTKASTLSLGASVKTIGSNAFRGCTALKKVTLGSKVTTVGTSAFRGCTKLTSVTLGAKVSKVNATAFYGCKNLKTITVKSKVLKSVGKKAISGINAKAKIKVPSAKVKAYKKVFKTSTGFKKTMTIKK